MRLNGRVAFVTGAARGQGRAAAVRFAEEGANVIAVDICRDMEGVPFPGATPEDLEETVRLVEGVGRSIIARPADVREFEQLKNAVDEGVKEFGSLDIVVANAGVVSAGRVEKLDQDVWQLMFDVNVTGVWKTAPAAIPHVRERGGGSIIITSSMCGLTGPINLAHYNASKHAVVGLMKTLCNELGRENIRVNCICPGAVRTPWWKMRRPTSSSAPIWRTLGRTTSRRCCKA
jgi:SDR family mycofactocin-dependent oxidoreductase